MKEIELKKSNNGMAVLTAVCVLYLCALVAVIISGNVVLDILACVWMALGWILLLGLKVLKPQEALVLTCSVNTSGR
jgi:hypothetical protein